MTNIMGLLSIGAIAVILVILYIAIKNFDFAGVSKSIGGFSSSLSDSINGFFENPFGANSETDEDEEEGISPLPSEQTDEEQEELFGRTLTDEEEETIEDIEQALAADDTEAVRNLINQFDGADTPLNQFNPEGIFGYGVLGKDNRGIPVYIARELGIYDLTTGGLTPEIVGNINDRLNRDTEETEERLDEQDETFEDNYDGTSNDREREDGRDNRGNDRTETEEPEEPAAPAAAPRDYTPRPEQVTPPNSGRIDQRDFEFFNADGGPQTGVIRETPTNLREGETASERASRIFETTGYFIGNARSQEDIVTPYGGGFNFGGNTGSGGKVPTVNQGGETINTPGVTKRGERRSQTDKDLEEERATLVFYSEGINNF